MAEFCSARSNTISPPQWTSFAPPFTTMPDIQKEEIVGYDAGISMSIHIYDGNIPVETSKVTFTLNAIGPDKTRLTAAVDFKLKGGLLGSIAKPLVKKQLGSDISKLLSANKNHVERLAI